MALSVVIDNETQTIHLTCSDVVSAQDVMDYEQAYWQEQATTGFNHLVDLRECLLDLEFTEIFELATKASPGSALTYIGARTALVIADDLQQELVEFYQNARHQVCDPKIREIGLFRDIEQARQWLMASTFAQTA